MFGITKLFISIKKAYFELNEIQLKHFEKNSHKFLDNSFRTVTLWKTRNFLILFPLKDKNEFTLCAINKRDCSCGSFYIGETKRYV